MATHRRIVTKEKSSTLYQTPAWATKALLKEENFSGNISEPCCGKGAIVNVLKEYGHNVVASDIMDYGIGAPRLDVFDVQMCTNVVTNPPFPLAEDIFHHLYPKTSGKLCLLLRLAFLEGVGRYNKIFSVTPPNRIYAFSERVTMYPDGEERGSGGTTAYGWFVWDKMTMTTIQGTQLHWIKPGAKNEVLHNN